jgi:glyoxylase-like metal-dependent hydrolase (beta-lactamase superfamily II)
MRRHFLREKSMNQIRVYPLHVGVITRPIAKFCRGLEPGVMEDLPLVSWYIRGYDKRILVDTGGGDPREASPKWLPFKREEDQRIDNALMKHNVRSGDIDIVLAAHLHRDHTGGNALFLNARVIAQAAELRYAHSPEAIGACLPGIVEDIDHAVVSGDVEIADGV